MVASFFQLVVPTYQALHHCIVYKQEYLPWTLWNPVFTSLCHCHVFPSFHLPSTPAVPTAFAIQTPSFHLRCFFFVPLLILNVTSSIFPLLNTFPPHIMPSTYFNLHLFLDTSSSAKWFNLYFSHITFLIFLLFVSSFFYFNFCRYFLGSVLNISRHCEVNLKKTGLALKENSCATTKWSLCTGPFGLL